MNPPRPRPMPGLTRTLMRALLPWMAGFWLATSVAVGWYMQHELAEQIDSGLVETAERLLDLAAHDARNHVRPSERDGTLYRLEVPHSNLTRPAHEGMMYQVVNERHELLLRSADAPREALRLPLETGFTEANDFRIYTLAHPTQPMFIHVGDPLSHRRASLREALFWLVVPLAGVVQQVLVAPGQAVRAGETLARLTSPELLTWQRELMQAESQARLAATRLERDEKLYAEGIIAGLRLQDSRTQHELAQAAVKEKRLALQMAGAAPSAGLQPGLAVRAQAAGTVLEVMAAPGQRLEAGMPVARVARGGRWALALQATPDQAARLRVGDALSVAGCQAPARLSAVVPQVTAGNQSVQLRADLVTAESCVRLNQFVQATVQARAGAAPAAGATAVRVPTSAVVRQAGRAHVFVRTAAGFVPTPVTLGAEAGDAVAVTAGLKAGDVVAVRGTAALKGAWQGLGGGN